MSEGHSRPIARQEGDKAIASTRPGSQNNCSKVAWCLDFVTI